MDKICQVMMNLIGSEICKNTVRTDEIKALSDEELKALYKLSKLHDLAHLVGDALIKNNLIADEKIKSAFQKELFTAVFRYESINYELSNIKKILSENEIPFIPLKGSVIREYYPEPWMRTSCDIDILIHEEDLNKAIEVFVKNGYTKEQKNYHDVSIYSVGGVHLELHFSILESKDNIDKVLCRAWEYAVQKNDFEYVFTNEFFLYHNIAHASYHFIGGGCGVRPFIDLFLLRKKMQYNEKKLDALLTEAGIKTFADRMEELSEVWLDGKEPSVVTWNMQDFVLNGGVYGSIEQHAATAQTKGGKFRHIMKRIFMPYASLVTSYPKLKKYPVLFPFYQVRRWCRILFCGGRKKAMYEMKVNANMDKAKVESARKLMEDLEL